MKNTHPTKESLEALRATLTNNQIAARLGVSVPTVKGWIKKLGIKRRPTKAKPASKREKPSYVALDEGVTLMQMCQQILGPRMREDHRGYMLDGRPCSSQRLVDAAGLTFGRRGKPVDPK